MLDEPEGVANRMRAGRACGRNGGARAFRAKAHGDLPSRKIHQRGHDKEWRHAIRATFEQHLVLALDDFESADPTPIVTPTLAAFRHRSEARSPRPPWTRRPTRTE